MADNVRRSTKTNKQLFGVIYLLTRYILVINHIVHYMLRSWAGEYSELSSIKDVVPNYVSK